MDWMFVYSPNLYVEILNPNLMVIVDGPVGGDKVVEAKPS